MHVMTEPRKLLTFEFIGLCLIAFLAVCNVSVFYNLFNYLQTLGIPAGLRGLVIGTYSLTAMVLYLIASPFLNTANAPRTMLLGMVLMVASGFAYFFVHSLWGLLALRMLNGAGQFCTSGGDDGPLRVRHPSREERSGLRTLLSGYPSGLCGSTGTDGYGSPFHSHPALWVRGYHRIACAGGVDCLADSAAAPEGTGSRHGKGTSTGLGRHPRQRDATTGGIAAPVEHELLCQLEQPVFPVQGVCSATGTRQCGGLLHCTDGVNDFHSPPRWAAVRCSRQSTTGGNLLHYRCHGAPGAGSSSRNVGRAAGGSPLRARNGLRLSGYQRSDVPNLRRSVSVPSTQT